ncbi:MAG TPA: ATP-binding cassette domain-containing protein [Iamia sp.]|nr:ATP-binding cassette domain-containing protein [Iamia sp.]
MSAVLEVEELAVAFGGVKAVDGVTFTLDAGRALGVVGPNGSGKTTCFNALCGVVRATGRVTVAGEALPPGQPGRARRLGILRVYQAPQAFPGLLAWENVALARPDRRGTGLGSACVARWRMARHERAREVAARDALARVGLAGAGDRPTEALTYGQLRLLDLARAIAGEPLVLLLDEPTAGLNEVETEQMVAAVAALRVDRPDLALAVIDHKISVIDALCDRVLALDLGRVVVEGAPDEVWAHEQVLDAYLGGSGARAT